MDRYESPRIEEMTSIEVPLVAAASGEVKSAAFRPLMADPAPTVSYDPPRVEARTDIGPALIGGTAAIGSGVPTSAAFRPI
jgi:hypothetical protein